MASQCLVNGIVHHLVHQMVKSSHPHVTDVHGGAHAHVLHAFKGLNLTGVIS